MRRFLLFVVVVAALVFVVVPYFFLPTFLEGLVARDVQNRLGLAEEPTVELESDPRWEMLRGEFSGGRISADDFDLGGVRTESAAIEVDDRFAIDVPESVRNRGLVPEGRISGRLRLEIPESEVSRLVRANASVPVDGIDLRDDGVTIRSEASALGTTFPVTVDGDLGVSGGSLVFEPRTVEAAGTVVPDWLAEQLLAGTDFGYPVGGLPYGGSITDARTTDGAVVITGLVPNVDLGALPAG